MALASGTCLKKVASATAHGDSLNTSAPLAATLFRTRELVWPKLSNGSIEEFDILKCLTLLRVLIELDLDALEHRLLPQPSPVNNGTSITRNKESD